MEANGILSSIKTTVAGLQSNIRKLDIISQNVANAERVPDKNGKLYMRQVVIESDPTKARQGFGDEMALQLRKSQGNHIDHNSDPLIPRNRSGEVLEVVEIDSEKLIFDPNHPRADENGYIRMPDVNMVEEMVDMMSASRAYEANLNVMQAAKDMAKKTLKI